MNDLERILIVDVVDATAFVDDANRRAQRESDHRDELTRIALARGVTPKKLARALRKPVSEVEAWAARAAARGEEPQP